jgi:hypothetical protein
MTIMRLVSGEDSRFDLYAAAPDGMGINEALAKANRVIFEVNAEGNETSDGNCKDGETLENGIRDRLASLGFEFQNVINTITWDEYHDQKDVIENNLLY